MKRCGIIFFGDHRFATAAVSTSRQVGLERLDFRREHTGKKRVPLGHAIRLVVELALIRRVAPDDQAFSTWGCTEPVGHSICQSCSGLC